MNRETSAALETQVFSSSALKAYRSGRKSADGVSDPSHLGIDIEQANASRFRLLNRDGTFNVERTGSSLFRSRGLYHYFMNVSGRLFFVYISAAYILINLLFASAYFACGPGGVLGMAESADTPLERFLECFFFSVQTFATVGYGRMTPHGLLPNLFAAGEAFVGLLGFALATGLFFARFSRPTACLLFSDRAVIAPRRAWKAFQFRVVNERRNQIIYAEARVVFSRLEPQGDEVVRKFYELQLERSQVMFFPLVWTVSHVIDTDSPLFGVNDEMLAQSDAEFLLLISGTDDTLAQQVFSASSYKYHEIVWHARFKNILEEQMNGVPRIALDRIHEIEVLPA
jgi:inward rectifier potassium channel